VQDLTVTLLISLLSRLDLWQQVQIDARTSTRTSRRHLHHNGTLGIKRIPVHCTT